MSSQPRCGRKSGRTRRGKGGRRASRSSSTTPTSQRTCKSTRTRNRPTRSCASSRSSTRQRSSWCVLACANVVKANLGLARTCLLTLSPLHLPTAQDDRIGPAARGAARQPRRQVGGTLCELKVVLQDGQEAGASHRAVHLRALVHAQSADAVVSLTSFVTHRTLAASSARCVSTCTDRRAVNQNFSVRHSVHRSRHRLSPSVPLVEVPPFLPMCGMSHTYSTSRLCSPFSSASRASLESLYAVLCSPF